MTRELKCRAKTAVEVAKRVPQTVYCAKLTGTIALIVTIYTIGREKCLIFLQY